MSSFAIFDGGRGHNDRKREDMPLTKQDHFASAVGYVLRMGRKAVGPINTASAFLIKRRAFSVSVVP